MSFGFNFRHTNYSDTIRTGSKEVNESFIYEYANSSGYLVRFSYHSADSYSDNTHHEKTKFYYREKIHCPIADAKSVDVCW